MFSFSTTRVAVAVALVCVLALAAFGAAGAAAQESDDANATESYEIAIDDSTRVVSSEWSGDTVTLVVEADETTQIAVTDASYKNVVGTQDLRRKQVTVPRNGQAEISFTVRNAGKPVVTVGTASGIILAGDQDGGGGGGLPGISGDSTWWYVQVAALGAAIGGALAIGLVGWSKVADRHDSHEVVRP